MTLTNEQCFERWAPDASPWSAWAKPVLFSQMDDVALRPGTTGIGADVEALLPAFAGDTAIVVDLDGREAVKIGLALARRGWRPVPLFNATTARKAIVDVEPIMELLLTGGDDLGGVTLPADAPPAFLLDALRMTGTPRPGDYDNRSIAMPQDFPSATFLRSRGIRTAVVLQEGGSEPKEDLTHVLLRWQQGGVALQWRNPAGGSGELQVRPPSMFRKAWYRFIVLFGLRRSNVGGFGAMVPEESSGGFGGYG